LGSPKEWVDRAAKAGDPWALTLTASRLASDASVNDQGRQVFALLGAAGIRNRSEALMIVAVWIGLENQDREKRKRALLFALAGLELSDTTDDPARFRDQGLERRIRQFIRDMAATLPPKDFVDIYRQFGGWFVAAK